MNSSWAGRKRREAEALDAVEYRWPMHAYPRADELRIDASELGRLSRLEGEGHTVMRVTRNGQGRLYVETDRRAGVL